MKILHIITGLDQGGAESALFRLVTFPAQSVEHIIISMTNFGIFGPRLLAAGIDVHALDLPRRKLTIKACVKLYKLVKKIHPDVVQTWMYHADLIGGIIARIAGVKRVYWGLVAFNLDRHVMPISTVITAKLCGLISRFVPHKIITCSKSAIDIHINFGYYNNFINIPLGCDKDEFSFDIDSRLATRAEWGLAEDDIAIGCVARWDACKGHRFLIEAFANLCNESVEGRNLRCVLIGPDMDEGNLPLNYLIREFVRDEVSVITAGRVESISSVMSALDVHVLPSLGEGFPNVVAEAMFCRTPCVVTNVGDAAMMVGDTGWVARPGDVTDLTNCLRIAINELRNRSSWVLRSDRCRVRAVQDFSLERMVGRYLEAWNCELGAN